LGKETVYSEANYKRLKTEGSRDGLKREGGLGTSSFLKSVSKDVSLQSDGEKGKRSLWGRKRLAGPARGKRIVQQGRSSQSPTEGRGDSFPAGGKGRAVPTKGGG